VQLAISNESVSLLFEAITTRHCDSSYRCYFRVFHLQLLLESLVRGVSLELQSTNKSQ
jgi:hypothetical protein